MIRPMRPAADGDFRSPLAIDGGPRVRQAPFPPWPVFGDEEIEAATAVLRSGKVNYWTGRETQAFEQEFAEAVGCRHAVAVANGTVALELALHALGIEPGAEVIVTCRSFIASASCCAVRGIVPVFADVDPHSQNITADSIRDALTDRTRAVIAVHLAGWPCEMEAICRLARGHGLAVIEDCAQAHGATYRGRPVGSLGDVAAFSFCQDKILTTGGEGGILVTNREDLWQRAWSHKDHGKSWQAVHHGSQDGLFRWLHESIGTNWRMTEMQAAIGRAALKKLPRWVHRRRRLAAMLDEGLGRLEALRIARPPAHIEHAYYKYYVFLRLRRLAPGWTRDEIVRALQAEGIPCGPGACPAIYREKAFASEAFIPPRRFPVAEQLEETSLMFLVHPTLSPYDVADVCVAVDKVLRVATAQPFTPRRAA